jgi:hypothetical protein
LNKKRKLKKFQIKREIYVEDRSLESEREIKLDEYKNSDYTSKDRIALLQHFP